MNDFQEAARFVLGNSATFTGTEDFVTMPRRNWETIFRFPEQLITRFQDEGLLTHKDENMVGFNLPKLTAAAGIPREVAREQYDLFSGPKAQDWRKGRDR